MLDRGSGNGDLEDGKGDCVCEYGCGCSDGCTGGRDDGGGGGCVEDGDGSCVDVAADFGNGASAPDIISSPCGVIARAAISFAAENSGQRVGNKTKCGGTY